MSSEIKLSSFPSGEKEALAFLYVQSQDLSGKTPAEISTMFYEAYYEILKDYHVKRESDWFRQKKEEVRQV